MKTLTAIVIAILVTLSCSSSWAAQNGPEIPTGSLNETETADLVLMREEEKLARDINALSYSLWQQGIFANISSAEQRHMDTVLSKLEYFGVEDPVISNEAGSFSNDELAALYDQLVDQVDDSLIGALQAGAYVEELDIEDLTEAIANTEKPTLINAYSNLLAASRNHLRSFVGQIANLSLEYQAQVLSQSDLDDIIEAYDVIPGENFTINAGLNDAWFHPATDGQGFLITVYPEAGVVFLAWFTFDTEFPAKDALVNLGDPGQRWLTAQGSYSGGQADLEISVTYGGLFDDEFTEASRNAAGSILLQFDDCTSGSVTYDIPSIGRFGVVPIVRVMTDNVSLCQELNALEE